MLIVKGSLSFLPEIGFVGNGKIMAMISEDLAVENCCSWILSLDQGYPVRILYTNYRGETAIRQIIPQRFWCGSSQWHPENQWLLDAVDVEKNASLCLERRASLVLNKSLGAQASSLLRVWNYWCRVPRK